MSRPGAALLVLGSVVLASHGASWATESRQATTLLELRVQGLEGREAEAGELGQLLLERVDKEGQEPLVLALVPVQTVAVPVGSRWVTRFEVLGLWGPRILLDADPATPRVWGFNLRPAGRLAGRLSSRSLPLPKRFFATSVLAGMGNAESVCSLGDQGAFECGVPAGTQDVVLAVGTFAPVRFQDRKVEAGKVLTLPVTELLPGASLRGEVFLPTASTEKPAQGPRARVFRFVAGARPSLEPPKPMAETTVAADGTFSFVGLEPGPVVLEVSLAGYSPYRLFPLELAAGTEVSVPEPIELTRPFEVVVEVTPATDVYGLPWKVVLERATADPAAPGGFLSLAGQTDPEGRFRARDQAPGRRRLEIRDSAGNVFHKDRDVWLAAGGEALLAVELALLTVRGRLALAGEPLAATLHFVGRAGHIEIPTDEEGRFEGVLPKPGVWPVEVDAAEFSTFTRVTVTPGLDEHRAEVDIDLPDTHLFGRVVDEQGNPVAGAEVEVSAGRDFREETTGADGTFEARAIPVGAVTVAADLKKSGQEPLVSEPQLIELREGQPLGPIELRVRALERREVRILRGSQPVPGAVVSLRSREGSLYGDQGISEADGGVRIKVDPRTREWDVILLAPGAALSTFRRTNNGASLVLQVEEAGGELTVQLPMALEEISAENLQPLLFRDGVPIHLGWMAEWRRSQGLSSGLGSASTRIEVPRLAPGLYSACLDSVERLEKHFADGGQSSLECRSGQLAPGGRLVLDLGGPRN